MKLEKHTGGWWIVGTEEYDRTTGPIGPYRTKAEARDGMRGVRLFFTKHINKKPQPKEPKYKR